MAALKKSVEESAVKMKADMQEMYKEKTAQVRT
jgi:hypothetical protein